MTDFVFNIVSVGVALTVVVSGSLMFMSKVLEARAAAAVAAGRSRK